MQPREGIVYNADDSAQIYTKDGWEVFHDCNGKELLRLPQTEREQLRQKFIQRASNPPINCSEISAEWYNYVDEMRALEEQLKAAGEVF